ncbi:PREDICTED: ribonuclease P/MRP protein subunit POP5-like [Priapulus caudatus]|uniref:Ribonuclease P/MRP protein subunit POP5 n=1 Tax=Priapulus caudatus TaxID=37621 RepID=A0ABM1DVS2_PRICU|nr:PREDICTED: ribonuclease P/MRP protein subunit POP5-like [Priapulus caudatus]
MVRFKNRYFVLEIVHPLHASTHRSVQEQKLTSQEVYHSLKEEVHKSHGDYGSAAFSISCNVKYLNPYTNTIFVRIRRGPHRFLATTLPFIKKIGKQDNIFLNTLYVGATVRNCHKFLRNHNRQQLAVLLKKITHPEERKKLQTSLLRACVLENVETWNTQTPMQ